MPNRVMMTSDKSNIESYYERKYQEALNRDTLEIEIARLKMKICRLTRESKEADAKSKKITNDLVARKTGWSPSVCRQIGLDIQREYRRTKHGNTL